VVCRRNCVFTLVEERCLGERREEPYVGSRICDLVDNSQHKQIRQRIIRTMAARNCSFPIEECFLSNVEDSPELGLRVPRELPISLVPRFPDRSRIDPLSTTAVDANMRRFGGVADV